MANVAIRFFVVPVGRGRRRRRKDEIMLGLLVAVGLATPTIGAASAQL
jgi:hypothetical protein